jgi:hypothetical protein
MDKTKVELAQYHHAACFSPATSTFFKAINNGNFLSWPGLTADLIQNHLPLSMATVKGHLKQEFKNLCSTKTTPQKLVPVDTNEIPPLDTPGEKTLDCFIAMATKEEGMTYSELAGQCPIRSSRGNQYILVGYDYDSNAILTELIKSRAAGDINKGVTNIIDTLTQSGHRPHLHILDNEASDLLKHSLLKYKIQYQLLPPHAHRIQQNEHFRLSRRTSLQAFARRTQTVLPLSGTDLSHKQQ